MDSILELKGVSRLFGGLHALENVDFNLKKGEIVGLIGPNGAGKTTLVNAVTGVHPPTSGSVVFRGRKIEKLKPYQISRLGVARTFQIVQPFPKMTVRQNVAAGALFAGHAQNIKEAGEQALEHLEFVGLADQAEKPAAALTLASRKRLEFAKSLAMRPQLLMLDEVNAGLNSTEVEASLELIREVANRGITILLIEHLMKVVLSVCTRVIVLHHGELIADDTAAEVVKDPAVVEAYLGSKFAARNKKKRK